MVSAISLILIAATLHANEPVTTAKNFAYECRFSDAGKDFPWEWCRIVGRVCRSPDDTRRLDDDHPPGEEPRGCLTHTLHAECYPEERFFSDFSAELSEGSNRLSLTGEHEHRDPTEGWKIGLSFLRFRNEFGRYGASARFELEWQKPVQVAGSCLVFEVPPAP